LRYPLCGGHPRNAPVPFASGGAAMKGWRECKLGDAPLEIIDGDRGKNYPTQNEFKDSGYCLFLSTKNVRSEGFEFSECQFISEEKDRLLRNGRLQRNDVVLTTRGTVGNIGYYDKTVKYEKIRINSGMVIIRPDQKYLLPDFNYYLFRKLQKDFHIYTSGSAQPQLPIKDLVEIPILLPPLPEQKAIAAVLSSLDDKIDFLQRQNKTLEAMAETLFRQWFVEPCKNGLPEGWREGKLGDVIELYYGKALKTEERTGIGYPVVGSSGIMDYHSEFLVKGPGIVIGRKGTIGKVIYLWDNFYPIDTTYYVKSKVESVGLFYEYFLLKTINFEEMNTDSAVPGLNRDIALSTEINIPPEGKLHSFNDLVATFAIKIMKNSNQIRTLEKLRDTLLPKLMSGEVRVEV
jgi:type I restriction enzyme S subunit